MKTTSGYKSPEVFSEFSRMPLLRSSNPFKSWHIFPGNSRGWCQMASHEICNPSLHLTIPPKSISIVRGQPLVSLARYAHLLTLMCVWAHTFTNTPPLSFVSKREHSHPFACARIRFVIIIVIPQRGLFLQAIIPSNWKGEPSLKSSLQHSGKELVLVTSWAKRCSNHPQEFKSSKSLSWGQSLSPTLPSPNPGERWKQGDRRERGEREEISSSTPFPHPLPPTQASLTHGLSLCPLCCPALLPGAAQSRSGLGGACQI